MRGVPKKFAFPPVTAESHDAWNVLAWIHNNMVYQLNGLGILFLENRFVNDIFLNNDPILFAAIKLYILNHQSTIINKKAGLTCKKKLLGKNLAMLAVLSPHIFRYQSIVLSINKHVVRVEMVKLSFPVFPVSMFQ